MTDTAAPGGPRKRGYQTASRVVGILILAAGLSILLGWWLRIDRPETVLPGLWPVSADAALGFAFLGLALWLQTGRARTWSVCLCAAVPALIGLFTLIEYPSGLDPWIERALVDARTDADTAAAAAGGSPPARVAQLTALGLLLFGLATACAPWRRPWLQWSSQWLALAGLAIGLVLLARHLYGVPPLAGPKTASPGALPAALLCLLCGAGLLLAQQDRGPMAVITSDHHGGYVARRVLLVATPLILVTGWLLLRGEAAGYYGTEFGLALFATVFVVAIALLIGWSARSLDALDAQRRHAEDQVRRERDFSAAMFNGFPGVLYLYDRSGRFLRWNRNLETATGYTAGEIATMHPLDLFAGDEKARVAARIGEVFELGESMVEASMVSRSGLETAFCFTGNMVRFDGKDCLIGVGMDITARRRAEQAQRASEASYKTLFEHAPDGILITDPDSRYLDANASVCRMLDYDRDQLLGLNAFDIVVADDAHRIAPALQTLARDAHYHREWQLRRRDGSTFPAEVIATVMPDGNLMAMIRDITQRKQAENALREINETLELRVAERTADLQRAVERAEAADRIKSAFLASMSHELRTPMNSIIGFTGVMLKGMAGPLNAEQAKQLGMVQGSARHLLSLINDVLDLSKIEAGQLQIRAEAFDLADSIRRVTDSMQPQAQKKATALTVEVAPGLQHMVSDRRRVEQILLNLLSNAIKFTEGGRVAVSATRLHDHRGAPAVRLSVVDTGIGIGPDDLKTLFQPFHQLDSGLARQHDGTGLGLAICRRLATLLGGDIAAASDGAGGSTFTVVLPLHIAGPSP